MTESSNRRGTTRAILDAAAACYLQSRRLDGPALTISLDELLEKHARRAADVRLILMGAPAHADTGCLCSAHATVSALLADLGARPDIATVIDMEASPEHVSRGTARHVDTLLLITEPYYRSLEAVKRLAQLARELPIPTIAVVANKVRSATDLEGVKDCVSATILPWWRPYPAARRSSTQTPPELRCWMRSVPATLPTAAGRSSRQSTRWPSI